MIRHSRVFRKYLISYIVILLIPIIAGYMSYRTSISVMTEVSIENSVMQLQKSKELLERRLAEVEGFTRQLAIDKNLAKLINERVVSNNQNVFGIWSSKQFLTTFGQTNDFLRNFFIYLSNYDIVLTPGSVYFRPDHYYENFHYNDMSFEEWRKTVLEPTHRSEIMPLRHYEFIKEESSVITYMQTLPLDSFQKPSPAVVVVMIDEKLISSLLSGITDRYGGWVHIADDKGQTISLQGEGEPDLETLAKDSELHGQQISRFYDDHLVISIRSDQNGWLYQAGLPREALMDNAKKIKAITMTVTGASVMIGLMVGLLLAYRNSVTLNRVLAVFGQEMKTGHNEYDFLQGNIAEMINNNKKLESELRRQGPLVRDAFFKRLISGEFQTRDEIIAAAIQVNAGLSGNTGYAAIIQIDGYSGMDNVEVLIELNAARLVLKQKLQDKTGPIPTTDLGSDKVVALFISPEEEGMMAYTKEQIDDLLLNLSASLFGEYKISILVSAGEKFDSLTGISHSFEQAKQAMDHTAKSNKKSVFWYGDTVIESATYYYPLDIELRLLGTLKAGEIGEAKKNLQSIISHNMEIKDLSVEMKNQLILEIKGTLLKLLDQKSVVESSMFEQVKNRIIGIQTMDTLDSFEEEVGPIMESLCEMITSKKNDMHIQVVEQIKQFIGENYSDSELTLYHVAEQVKRPEKSISQIFKNVTGSNLSDYLEKVRLDRASELLKENTHTIDDIASLVGYNSSHSFRRAFKRVMGVSPSVYRQSSID